MPPRVSPCLLCSTLQYVRLNIRCFVSDSQGAGYYVLPNDRRKLLPRPSRTKGSAKGTKGAQEQTKHKLKQQQQQQQLWFPSLWFPACTGLVLAYGSSSLGAMFTSTECEMEMLTNMFEAVASAKKTTVSPLSPAFTASVVAMSY